MSEAFTFKVEADHQGIAAISFKKEPEYVIATLLNILDCVNQSFDQPFPTVGDFCRELGNMTDTVERNRDAGVTEQATVGQPAAD